MITTSYGTWCTKVDDLALTVEQTIAETLGDADEYDIDAIAADYRTAINKALPEGVTLAGNDFYGPYYTEDATWGPELEDEDGRLDIKAIVLGVDLWAIAAKHEIAG